MALTYPNIVPENDLRLPDALTIKHGPVPLLAHFVLEADKASRRNGLRLQSKNPGRDTGLGSPIEGCDTQCGTAAS